MEEELFAMEELAQTESPVQLKNPHQYTMPAEIHSKEDPVLVEDSRVLSNLIDRQHQINSNKDYFATVQTEIKPHMRKIVTSWMVEVTEEQHCQAEVLHLAINYLDRFLATKNISKTQFQLVAATCMFLASKFKETCPLPAEHLVVYTDYSITVQELLAMEMILLDAIHWDLSAVTPYSILDQILRTVTLEPMFDPRVVRTHAETFVALAATEYAFCHQSPLVVAVACLGAALRGLNPEGLEAMLSAVHLISGLPKEQIKQSMDLIEESIQLSMSGKSFQPTQMNNNVHPSKVTQKQQQFYSSTSTTPTDIMDVTKACLY